MNPLDAVLRRVAATPSADPLVAALAHETLISERLRMRLLAVLIGFIELIVVAVLFIAPQMSRSLFGSAWWVPPVLLGTFFFYELFAQFGLGQFIQRRLLLPEVVRYANALFEVTFPTLGVWFVAQAMPFEDALNSPPSLLYYFIILLSVLRLEPRLCVFTGFMSGAQYLLVGIIFGTNLTLTLFSLPVLTVVLYRSVFLVMAGLAMGFVAQQVRAQLQRTLKTVQERDRVLDMFGQHVSPAVADKLLAQGFESETETRAVCLMFVDIRDFTTYAEKTPPQEVVAYLNTLFPLMIESVNKHQGIVNKFLGDGFMAVFGAPLDDDLHIQHAVEAARDILLQVDALNASQKIPQTRIGIGLHAGEAVIGNVGSTHRQEYTIIGDVVNLASRIEQLNKQFGSRLLISETVWLALAGASRSAEALGAVSVKGHEKPVPVYKLD